MDAIVKMIDRELAQAESAREQLTARVRALRKARAVLVAPALARTPKAKGAVSARAKAGPAAILKVQETLTTALDGRATQAAVTAAVGLNSGQVSAALTDLENRGIVRKTGAKQGRSFEYEVVAVG